MDLSKLSDSDLMALQAGKLDQVSDEGLASLQGGGAPAAPEPSKLAQAFDYGTRALDYAGGVTRTGAAQLADTFVPEDIVKLEDWLNASKGKAPGSSEYLRRSGVPAGANLSDALPGLYSDTGQGLRFQKGGSADPSARDAAGFVSDVALDPTTYLSLGAVPALKAAANPIGRALKSGGKSMYKSGFKAVDAKAAEFGKDAASELLFRKGITGTNTQIAKKAEGLGAELLNTREATHAAADALGAKGSPAAAMQHAQLEIARIRATGDPALLPVADAMEEQIAAYLKLADAGSSTLSGYKTSITQGMGSDKYNTARQTAPGTRIEKAMARGLREESENAAERAVPGFGTDIKNLNNDLGTLLTVRKTLANEAKKGEAKNTVTSVDPIVWAIGGAPIAAAKKAADISKTTWLRSKAGKSMYDVGNTDITDPILRQMLIDAAQSEEQKKQRSVWEKLSP